MTERITLACDPGVSGAIARFNGLELHEIVDMEASGGLVTAHFLTNLFAMAGDLVIEQVAPMGKNGSIGNFKLGFNYGVIIGAAEQAGLRIHRYTPAVWKRAMGLAGKDKNASRHLAADLYGPDDFKRVKDDGRAEAVLIGHYHLTKKEQ